MSQQASVADNIVAGPQNNITGHDITVNNAPKPEQKPAEGPKPPQGDKPAEGPQPPRLS